MVGLVRWSNIYAGQVLLGKPGQALGIAVGKASQALGKASATSNFVAAELRTLELDGRPVDHHQRYHDTKDTNDARTVSEDTFTN